MVVCLFLLLFSLKGVCVVSFAAGFWDVTQRSRCVTSPKKAAKDTSVCEAKLSTERNVCDSLMGEWSYIDRTSYVTCDKVNTGSLVGGFSMFRTGEVSFIGKLLIDR